ncbi:hypothetical protein OC846_005374 [Tilletia horrida]|uniref:Uncharacterized protein n=1 Tax=Tilletia horrida TaxID=155126 RepID=A0AAN6GKY2_9BASI|nr:hypothetical protein OC846_005374 [Tilletia horrida]KAK0561957.1 hypothetical protein OC861_005555 [Tilletia horrida]
MSTRDESIQAAKKKLKAYRAKQAQAHAAASAAAAAQHQHARKPSHSRKPSIVHLQHQRTPSTTHQRTSSIQQSTSPSTTTTPTPTNLSDNRNSRRLSRHARTSSIANHRQSVDLMMNIPPALAALADSTPPSTTINSNKRLSRHMRTGSIATKRESLDLMSAFTPPSAPPSSTTTMHERRQSRHNRTSSIATKRESIEIMGGVVSGGTTTRNRRSQILPSSLLFNSPNSNLTLPPGGFSSSHDDDDDDTRVSGGKQDWLSALEKLEGRRSPASPNSRTPTQRTSNLPPPRSPSSFAAQLPQLQQQQQSGNGEDGSKSNTARNSIVELPSFDDVHGPEAMDKRLSADLIERNLATTSKESIPASVGGLQGDLPAPGRARPQSLYGASFASAQPLSSLGPSSTAGTLGAAAPVGGMSEFSSIGGMPLSQSQPDGLGTLTELAEADEEEEEESDSPSKKAPGSTLSNQEDLDRIRKQARRASLTPRPLKLKSRPASLFLPSGGLAGAMAHRMGGTAGGPPPVALNQAFQGAHSADTLSGGIQRRSLLFTAATRANLAGPAAAKENDWSTTASSPSAASASFSTTPAGSTSPRTVAAAMSGSATTEPTLASDPSPSASAATAAAAPMSDSRIHQDQTTSTTVPAEPRISLEGDTVTMPTLTATTAAAQAAVGTTKIKSGMRALRLGSLASATSLATIMSPSAVGTPGSAASATSNSSVTMSPPPSYTGSEGFSSTTTVTSPPAASPLPPTPQTAPASTTSAAGNGSGSISKASAGRRSSIVYRSSSNTTSATSSNFGNSSGGTSFSSSAFPMRRTRRTADTADSSASSISPPSSISTTHGIATSTPTMAAVARGGSGLNSRMGSSGDASTITVSVATYEDMCTRATQTEAVRRSLDRTARELAISESERLRAMANLQASTAKAAELEEQLKEAGEQAEMLNEDVEGWRGRCQDAEAGLGRERRERDVERQQWATREQQQIERTRVLTAALEQAGVAVPEFADDGEVTLEQQRSEAGEKFAIVSGLAGKARDASPSGKLGLDKLDLASVLKNPPSPLLGAFAAASGGNAGGLSPGGYFALAGTSSAALATPALMRSAGAAVAAAPPSIRSQSSQRQHSDGSANGAMASGSSSKSHSPATTALAGATPQFDPEATVRLLRDMRQQIFNLAGRLDFERKEHDKTKDQLAQVQAELAKEQKRHGQAAAELTRDHVDDDFDLEASAGLEGRPIHDDEDVTRNAGVDATEPSYNTTTTSGETARTQTTLFSQSHSHGSIATSLEDHDMYEHKERDADRASSSTPGLEYDHRPTGSSSGSSGSFSHLRTIPRSQSSGKKTSAFNSGTFGYDDQLRAVEEADESLRDDVIRQRGEQNKSSSSSSSSSAESHGPPSPPEMIDIEAQMGGDDTVEDDDGDSAFVDEDDDEDDGAQTPELDIEQWNRPEYVRAWSLERATAAAKKSRSRAVRLNKKRQAAADKADANGAAFAASYRGHRFNQPSYEDFFGIMTDIRLPPLPTTSEALDMPPVYSDFDPAVGRVKLSAGKMTSYIAPEVYEVLPPSGLPASFPSQNNGGGLTRSSSLTSAAGRIWGGGSKKPNASASMSSGHSFAPGAGPPPSSANRALANLPKRLSMPAQPAPVQTKRLSATRPLKAFVDRSQVQLPQAAKVADLDFTFATVSGVGPVLQL